MVIEAAVDLKNVACCRLLEGLGLREDLSRREVMTWMGERRGVGVFEFSARSLECPSTSAIFPVKSGF